MSNTAPDHPFLSEDPQCRSTCFEHIFFAYDIKKQLFFDSVAVSRSDYLELDFEKLGKLC